MYWDCGEKKARAIDPAVDCVKKVKAINDKDFKIAERNFRKIGKEIEELRHQAGKAEAGATYSIMRMAAIMMRLYKKGVLEADEVESKEDLRLIPKGTIKFISDLFGHTQKHIRGLIKQGIEAGA